LANCAAREEGEPWKSRGAFFLLEKIKKRKFDEEMILIG